MVEAADASARIRVLVVDDHEIIRDGLAAMLAHSAVFVAGTAADGQEAVRLARKLRPEVVLLDVRLGTDDGLAFIGKIKAAAPDTRVVVFSAFDSPTFIARAVSAGAHDYLLKDTPRDDLVAAVAAAARGVAPPRSAAFRRVVASMTNKTLPEGLDVPLTPREIQVLRLVSMGLSNQEISESLEISIETVKEHVQNMLRKLSLGDRTQAAVWAIRHGLD